MKRAFDIAAAAVLLLAASPLLLALALLVKVTSPGPAFFGHGRIGREGKPFRCWKFRTMVADAEAWLERHPELRRKHRANGFKLRAHEDPRITSPGRLLRYTHLDELPQLVNVLKGDMSMVGPRPIVEEELAWYGKHAEELLSVRPGIFGPWTAGGKARAEYPARVDVELAYVRRHSLLGDLGILLRNVPVLLTGQVEEDEGDGALGVEGAHGHTYSSD